MKKSETIKDVAGIIILFLVLALGIVAINTRMGEFNSNQNIASLRN